MTDTSNAVFLSYASQDSEAATRICEALRAAGIEVWFDQSELRGGEAWDRQIRRQIHDCALFMPIISANSQARLKGYFRREWRLAADRTIDMAEEKAFLMPVVIDDTSERQASVRDKLREVQRTHLQSGQPTPGFVNRVHLVMSPSTVEDGGTAQQAERLRSAPKSHAPSSRRGPAVAHVAFGLVLLGGYFAWRQVALRSMELLPRSPHRRALRSPCCPFST